MALKLKTISRSGWKRVFSSAAAYQEIRREDFYAVTGLLYLHGVTAPLDVDAPGGKIRIVDEGYTWLQIAPEGENWWLTVMFDCEGNLVQHYFDITWKNNVDGANSCFEDLYLDVVMMPDGRMMLLDKNELDDALKSGEIDGAMYDLAVKTANMLMERLSVSWPKLNDFCIRTRQALLQSMR